MVTDISSNEVSSSIGESGVPYSQEFNSRIIKHVMDKYNISENEARRFVARARSTGASNEGDYMRYANRGLRK
jgi:hypothetical protein